MFGFIFEVFRYPSRYHPRSEDLLDVVVFGLPVEQCYQMLSEYFSPVRWVRFVDAMHDTDTFKPDYTFYF